MITTNMETNNMETKPIEIKTAELTKKEIIDNWIRESRKSETISFNVDKMLDSITNHRGDSLFGENVDKLFVKLTGVKTAMALVKLDLPNINMDELFETIGTTIYHQRNLDPYKLYNSIISKIKNAPATGSAGIFSDFI